MSDVFTLIQKLGAKGIKLWLEVCSDQTEDPEETQLKFKAPKGALTKTLRDELLKNKQQVIEFLSRVKVGKTVELDTIPFVDRVKTGSSEENTFRLSFAQQRLWFIDQFEPNSGAYNIPTALYLTGDLNVEALRLSFEIIVNRHESLRTNFKSVDGEPVQVIGAKKTWSLPIDDLSFFESAEGDPVERDLTERDATVLKLAQQETELPFDLVNGPLLRTRLIKLNDRNYALLATMHHVVADGWSMEVLINELSILYKHFKEGRSSAPPLEPLPIQYVDFAEWQRDSLKDDELEKQLSYWKKHLHQAPPRLTLFTDKPRPKIQSKNGAHLSIAINKVLVDQLLALSQRNNATLYMTLMAAFKLLLSRYSQQQDITVGMPIAGRNRAEVEPLIGFFVNSLVTRTIFDDNPSVNELIARERVSVLGAYANQDIPFEAVVDVLDLERDLGYAPVRQTAFSLTKAAMLATNNILEGIALEQMPVSLTTSKVDLSLLLEDDSNSDAVIPVFGSFEYNTDLFCETTIRQMSEHYLRILACFVEDAQQCIASIDLVDNEELKKLLELDGGVESVQPLTSMQRDFYLISASNTSTLVCSVGVAIRLSHPVDSDRWCESLQLVSDQYCSLRTKLLTTAIPYLDPVYQVVEAKSKVELKCVDLSHLHIDVGSDSGSSSNVDAESTLRDFIEEFVFRPYDLESDALTSYALVKLSDSYFVPVLAGHHSVWDGKSLSNHLKTVLAVYELGVRDEVSNEVPNETAYEIKAKSMLPDDCYFDFVHVNRSHTDTAEVSKFWIEKFSGVEPLVTSVFSETGKLVQKRLTITQAHRKQIEEYCENQLISKANYFKCLFSIIISEYYRAEYDFVLGEIGAGRSEGSNEGLGCFMQVTPFVVPQAVLSGASKLKDYFEYSRRFRKNLGNNQYISMLRQSQLTAKSTLNFQVNYRLTSVSTGYQFMGTEADIEYFSPDSTGIVKLVTTQRSEDLELALHFYDGEFDDLELLQRLESLSQQVVNGASQFDDLNLLLEGEETDLLRERNNTNKHYSPASVPNLISSIAHNNPKSIAVIFEDQSISYELLELRSNQIARLLMAANVGSGTIVGLCLDRSVELIVAMLAIIKTGAAYMPMDASLPKDRLTHMLSDSKASILITEKILLGDMPECTASVIVLDEVEDNIRQQIATPLAISIDASSPAYVIYTSGSTGTPKGVLCSHGNLQHYTQVAIDTYGITGEDVVLQFSSISFDASIEDIFPALCTGAKLVLRDEGMLGDARAFFSRIDRYKVTVMGLPTAYWHELVGQLSKDIVPLVKQMRIVMIGGERALPSKVLDWLEMIGSDVCLMNTYGPTETTVVAVATDLKGFSPEESDVPIGKPLPNVQCYILSRNLKLVPPGVPGELCIAGAGVTLGYLDRPEQSAKVYLSNPFINTAAGNCALDNCVPGKSTSNIMYRTGDLVRYRENGEIEYLGRLDDQVKIRGYRIEISEVEQAISKLELVRENVVHAVDDSGASSSMKLVAFIVLKNNSASKACQQEAIDSIRQQLSATLPEYMLPGGFAILESIPKTSNGKVSRNNIERWLKLVGSTTEYLQPRTDTEKGLEEIWKSVLGLKQVSITDNFFNLGGHSLLATQVVSRIRDRFYVELPLRKVFEGPTIESMAKSVAIAVEVGLIDTAPKIVNEGAGQRKVLSFAQHRLWFIDQLDPGQSTYNMPAGLRIKGKLDCGLLGEVFKEIVNRHEVLRSNFVERIDEESDIGLVELIVHPSFDWQMPIVDLSLFEEAKQLDEIQRLVAEDANTPFDLKNDTLLRTHLLKISATEHVLLICMHHIVSDGWSISLMIKEVAQLYAAFKENKPSPLSPLHIQYSDYASWQRRWLTGDVLKKQLDYWVNQLSGAPDVLRLPTDRPRPKRQTFNGAHLTVRLDSDFTHDINQFCQQHAITPFILLMSAYQLLLSRYCSQEDVCVGIPIAGRNRAAIENLIGFFINGIVIRTDLSGNPKVSQLIARVREVALGAFSHQDTPADLLVDALQMERSQSFSPGAQVGFAWQNTPHEKLDGQVADLSIVAVERVHKTAKYELSLILAEDEQGIGGVVEYNTDLFDVSTIDGMMRHYKTVLRTMMRSPDLQIDNVALVDESELRQVLNVDDSCEVRRLTTKQRDFYLDTLVSKTYGQNCMGYYVELKTDNFSLDLWEKAQIKIAASQSLMRTRIVESAVSYTDVAYQVVEANVELEVNYVDYTDEKLTENQIHDLVNTLVQRPWSFDEKLVTYHVLKVAEDVHCIAFSGHHLLLDGVGFALHAMAAVGTYSLMSLGKEVPPYPDLFAGYINDNRDKFDTYEVIEFWKQRFTNVEALDFTPPTDIDGSEITLNAIGESDDQGEKNILVEHSVDPVLWKKIQQYCDQNKTTPALFFKSIYGLLIQLYCRADSDFTMTEFTVGRSKENAKMLGCYFQSLPFVFENRLFGAESSFIEACQYARQFKKVLGSNEFISDLEQRRLLPNGRLNFMYNFYHFLPTFEFMGKYAKSQHFVPDLRGSVQLVIAIKDDGLDLKLTYLPSLFSDLRLLQRIENLAEQIVSGVDRVGDFNYLLKDEIADTKKRAGERTELIQTKSVIAQFEEQVVKDSTAIALIAGEDILSYETLNSKVNQVANYILSKGISCTDRVAVCLEASSELIVTILAIVKVGATYVPIDPSYPKGRIKHILEDSQVTMLISQECTLEYLGGEEFISTFTANAASISGSASRADLVFCIDQSEVEVLRMASENLNSSVSDEQLFYVIYTSGSTGQPKGTGVTVCGVNNLLDWYNKELSLNATDNVLLVSSIGFDLTQKNIFGPLMCGSTLVLPQMKQYDAELIANTIESEKITVVNCAPSAFYGVLDASEDYKDLSSLTRVVLGGEPIQKTNLSPWLSSVNCQCKVMNSYGPTECTDVVAFHWVESVLTPIGKAISNTTLSVLDDNLQPVPTGIVGELCVRGASVGSGYLNQDELTAKVFVEDSETGDRLYRTGDLVRYQSDGNLEYVGRRDFQIKLRGLRIELGEVESALVKQEGVNDALVLLKEEQLVAYVITNGLLNGLPEWNKSLKQSLQAFLPEYMIPHHFVVLEAWPLNANGKINRALLHAPTEWHNKEFIAPRNDIETKLAEIWCDVLAIDKVSIDANFFELGGHSLLAARAASKFRKSFEVDVPLRALFDLHTIAQISEYIETLKWAIESAKNSKGDMEDSDAEGRIDGLL